MTTTAPDTQRRSNWVTSYDNVYYRPRLSKKPSSLSVARFPAPLIGPRRSRPQAIHIISYPSGYVPRELRPGNRPDTPPPPPAPRRLSQRQQYQHEKEEEL
ncbi:hypothetical protein N0V84_011089 [Fusarium piperis]|uniref:Uncharacterized protein n=1 Tax=Fusarium piperis TaxID=1435070 RepID=A0A9W8W4F8_9HYPO|nr:hypothetical protein N0V84_011089 [Fusarium piperis]